MAFRKKAKKIFDLNPDILVLQECEHEEKLQEAFKESDRPIKEIHWIGDNPHKGVALINFTDYPVQISSNYNPKFRYIIPFQILSPKPIVLFSIWAMPSKGSPSKSYVGQIWAALAHYEIESKRTILIGDFHSHVKWDHQRRIGNHSDVVAFLAIRKIHSLYHRQHAIKHGNEIDPTFYMYKHKEKPYHLDYCFLSTDLIHENSKIEIGNFEEWKSLSDHMPLVITSIG